MPKLTKAQREAAEEQAVHAALRWPEEAEPARMTEDEIKAAVSEFTWSTNEVVRAWTFNAYSREVSFGCFGRSLHSPVGAKLTTQTRGGPWFHTEREATLAMRWAACRGMARELRRLELRAALAIQPD